MSELKRYQCHKRVHARPMNLGDYNDYRGWAIPVGEDPSAPGYLVIYNKDTNDHYESWSPQHVFDDGYTELPEDETGLNFGQALEALKAGRRVARKGWNGKGMWLVLVPGTPGAQLHEGTPYRQALGQETCEILPHIDMWTTNAAGRRAMLSGWLASQTDMLSEDWEVVND